MGYYTFYELDVYSKSGILHENGLLRLMSIDLVGIMAGNEDKYRDTLMQYVKESDGFYWLNRDMLKWYEHDEHIIALSKMYPEYLFRLRGDGEESDDFWITDYKDGKVFHYNGNIVYGEPEPSSYFHNE